MNLKKALLVFVTSCFCYCEFAFSENSITEEQKHLFFIAGVNQGERNKQNPISDLKHTLDRLRLYGINDRKLNNNDEPESVNPLFPNGKQKSKSTIAKEERDNAKRQKRTTIEADEKDAELIAATELEIKKLNDKPSEWAVPLLQTDDSEVGKIGCMNDYWMFTVTQSISEDTAIVSIGEQKLFYLKGLRNSPQLIDGDKCKIPGVLIIDPPTRYTTVLGSTKTVRTLRRLSVEEEKEIVEYVANQLAANQPASVDSPSSAESK
jgi:hypothetical protein